MKKVALLILIVFTLAIIHVMAFAQKADLSGTWVGTAEVPDAPELDQVTLVLIKEGDSYTGTVTDSMGMAQESEIEEVEFKDNTLTLQFLIFDGDEYATIFCTMEVEGNSMSGYWEDEGGSSGELKLTKK